jgi:hypothetical protein
MGSSGRIRRSLHDELGSFAATNWVAAGLKRGERLFPLSLLLWLLFAFNQN